MSRDMEEWLHGAGPFDLSTEPQAVDAKLIAAAPDMFAALERIANEPCDHGPGFCPREFARALLQRIEE
jgi:hypothetical protein